MEEAADGNPELSEVLGLRLGYSPSQAITFCRAAANHLLEQAKRGCASGRRPEARLAEDLKRARRWRSEAEQRATEEMIRNEAEAHALRKGQPELLADEGWFAAFRKQMHLRLPLD